jgi:hypothetical protein
MTRSALRSLSLLAPLAFALSAAACSDGSEEGGPPAEEVTDQLGRSCSVEDAAHVTCDEAPAPTAGCAGGAAPCFTLGTTGDAAGPGAICASCCSGDTAIAAAGDCSNIACTTENDCPKVYGRCVSGQCRH